MIWENRIKITVFTDVIHHIYKKLPFIEDRSYTFLLYIFCIFVPLQLLSYNPNSSKCVSILGQYSKIEKQYLEGALSVKLFFSKRRKSRQKIKGAWGKKMRPRIQTMMGTLQVFMYTHIPT